MTTGVEETGVDSTGAEDADIDPAGTDPDRVSVDVESDVDATTDDAIELDVYPTDTAADVDSAIDAETDQDPASTDVAVDPTSADDVTSVEEDRYQLDSKAELELVSIGATELQVQGTTLDSAAAELGIPALILSVEGSALEDAGQSVTSGPQLVIVTSFVENTVEASGGAGIDQLDATAELELVSTGVTGVLGTAPDSAAGGKELTTPKLALLVEGAAAALEEAGQSVTVGPQLVRVTSFVENTVASRGASAAILSRADKFCFCVP